MRRGESEKKGPKNNRRERSYLETERYIAQACTLKESPGCNDREGAHPLSVIYEDNHILALIKPPGILSQADGSEGTDILSAAGAYLKRKYQKPGNVFVGLVHRLDRNTGGTMLLAKTSKGAARLSEQLRMKRFRKGYFAVTEGVPTSGSGFLRHNLQKDQAQNMVRESRDGKLSVLYYRTVRHTAEYALLFVIPITGRTHQIRSQFSLIGYPLAGDQKYGGEICGCAHALALWSSVIWVKHPVRDSMLLLQSIPDLHLAPWSVFPAFDRNVFQHFLEQEVPDIFIEAEENRRLL